MEKVPGPLLVLLEELGLAAVLRHAVAIRQDAATHIGGHGLLGVQQDAEGEGEDVALEPTRTPAARRRSAGANATKGRVQRPPELNPAPLTIKSGTAARTLEVALFLEAKSALVCKS